MRLSLRLAAIIAVIALPLSAAEKETDRPFADQVRPFLVTHCLECHGPEKPKGDFRIDRLSPEFGNRAAADRWQSVFKRIQAGEMPPKAKARPPEKDRTAVVDWIAKRTKAADAERAAAGRTVLRRLNRNEYQNTMRDLLGVEIELRDLLPPDSSANGFDNVGEVQHLSSFVMDRYLEAADLALNVAIANGPQPPVIKKRFLVKDERQVKSSTESVYREIDDGTVLFSSSAWTAMILRQFYPPDRGYYRFRISASAFQSGNKPVSYRIDAGQMLMATKSHLLGYFDAKPGEPKVLEFTEFLEARSTIRIQPHGLANAQSVHKEGADKWNGAGLALNWIEVEGPLHETWPPKSHRAIFGDLERKPDPQNRNRLEVASAKPAEDAERILRDFARRAFRRPVSDSELKPYIELVAEKLAARHSFERAVRVGLAAILVSPEFHFFREKPGPLDDFALASRLSYFLWSTMPDAELLALAEQKKLNEPEILRKQVERMLKHPKAAAFTENFVGQWLGLRDIDFTSPDFRLYPEFDDMLKAAMVDEVHLFFGEVLKENLSLTNFVASDFTFLNGRLARHYGVPGVEGHKLVKTRLPANSHRGGVMTMGAVLKVTANGTTTSPVVRGAWVLDRILGTPPAPPPSGVPAVMPDIRGATTIREQLAKHRADAVCATCHTKIDPPGFALESFDVIGGWRDYYRSVGNGKPVTIDGRRMPYAQGKNVDPADVLANGDKFANIDEFKQILLKDKDQLARALAVQLMTYATGAAPNPADAREIEAITAKIRKDDYGFRSLVHEVVQSKMFRNK